MRNVIIFSFLLGLIANNAFAQDMGGFAPFQIDQVPGPITTPQPAPQAVPAPQPIPTPQPSTPQAAAPQQIPQAAPVPMTNYAPPAIVAQPATGMPVRGVDIMTQDQWNAYEKARLDKQNFVSQQQYAAAPAPVTLPSGGMPVAGPGPEGPPGPPGPPGLPAPGAAPQPFRPSGYVEAGGDYQGVTHNFGNWSGEYLKGEVQTDESNRWSAEGINQREFGSHGIYGDIGNTHVFDEDWYTSITGGLGGEGIYIPRYRVDAFLNRKWLDQRQFITTVGFGADGFQDGHKDESVFFGATYYFAEPWNVQGGVRINDSTPGGVWSAYEFVAVTEGTEKHHFLTLRYGFGKEAYQVIGPGHVLSDFYSQQISLELREWVGEDWGFDARGEAYHNPNYDRFGGTMGVFKEF